MFVMRNNFIFKDHVTVRRHIYISTLLNLYRKLFGVNIHV